MLVRDVMTGPAVSVGLQDAVAVVIRLLDRHEITAVPVVDDRGRPIGIVSEADVLRDNDTVADREATGADRDEQVVADVMTGHVITANEDDDVSDVVDLMLQTGIKSVPVVHGGVVVGMLSRHDVVHAIATGDDRIKAEIQEHLSIAGLHSWSISVDDGMVELSGEGSDHEERLATRLVQTVAGVAEVHVSRPGQAVT